MARKKRVPSTASRIRCLGRHLDLTPTKRRMMKKIIFIFLPLVLLCGLLAGCQCELVVPPPPPAGEGTLNLYGVDPLTLDPALSSEMTSHEYVMQLFSGLVRPGDDLQPTGDIAESWQISDDGRTYTFYLRQDVKFHDGRQVKADDFKYSWERACYPETGSMTAATHLGGIVGGGEGLGGITTGISGIKIID